MICVFKHYLWEHIKQKSFFKASCVSVSIDDITVTSSTITNQDNGLFCFGSGVSGSVSDIIVTESEGTMIYNGFADDYSSSNNIPTNINFTNIQFMKHKNNGITQEFNSNTNIVWKDLKIQYSNVSDNFGFLTFSPNINENELSTVIFNDPMFSNNYGSLLLSKVIYITDHPQILLIYFYVHRQKIL